MVYMDEENATMQIGNSIFKGKLENKGTRTLLCFEGDEYKFKTNKIINMKSITKITDRKDE